jgi:hypothetical protein
MSAAIEPYNWYLALEAHSVWYPIINLASLALFRVHS